MKKSLILAILVGALMLQGMSAMPTGIGGSSVDSGCLCHGGADSDVSPVLEGLPEVYNGSEVYNLTISFTGGPAESGVNSGGFNLRASHGEFIVVDKEEVLMIYPKEKEQEIKNLLSDIKDKYQTKYL